MNNSSLISSYNQYNTNKIIELINEKIEIQHTLITKMDNLHKIEITKLENKYNLLNAKIDGIIETHYYNIWRWLW